MPLHKKAQEDATQMMMQQMIQVMGKLQTSVKKLSMHNEAQERGTFPAQPQPNPNGQGYV